MAAKTPRAAAPQASAAASSPWQWAADWNRQQAALAGESARTLYRGFEAMRRIQEQTARAAAERHATAAGKLRQCTAPTDVALLQGELLRDDLAGAARYWQDLADAVLEMNAELVDCATRMVDTEDVFAPTSARFLHS